MKRKIAVILMLLMLLPGSVSHAYTKEKIAVTKTFRGETPFEMSIDMSSELYPNGSDHLLILSAASYADGLSALPLANLLDAPLLFSDPKVMDGQTLTEIKRLNPKRIYLVGGKGVLSFDISDQLRKLFEDTEEKPQIFRFSGRDRFVTSTLIANYIYHLKDTTEPIPVYLANGFKMISSLSMGSTGVTDPILLTEQKDLVNNYRHDCPASFLRDHASRVTLLGSRQELHARIHTKVTRGNYVSGTAKPLPITRIEAYDEYHLSAVIAGDFTDSKNLVVADGKTYTEAIMAAKYAAKTGTPLLLIQGDGLSPEALAYIRQEDVQSIVVVGGADTLGPMTRYQLIHGKMY